MFWIGLFVGAMFIGAPTGAMVIALCVAAKRGDENAGEVYQRRNNI